MQDAATYCDEFVKSTDEDRWLAARYAEKADQRLLMAIAALRCEIARIPSLVSEPMLGEIRLRWWRDGLAEMIAGQPPRAHPVIEELAEFAESDCDWVPEIDSALEGFSRVLYGDPFADFAELQDWLALTDGAFDHTAARFMGASADSCDLVRKASVLFTLARDARNDGLDLIDDPETYITESFAELRLSLRKVDARLLPVVLPFALVPEYLKHRRGFPVVKRLRLFSAYAFSNI